MAISTQNVNAIRLTKSENSTHYASRNCGAPWRQYLRISSSRRKVRNIRFARTLIILILWTAACSSNDDTTSGVEDTGDTHFLTDIVGTPDDSALVTNGDTPSVTVPQDNPWAQDATSRINFYRRLVGLSAVTEDPILSAACQKHAEYMALNQVLTHNEDPGLPGYSEEGAKSGKFSNIASGYDNITIAIDKWIEGIYHRLPLFEPGLRTIGVGMVQNYWCLDVISGAEFYLQHGPLNYPASGQHDVPILFDGTESPNPLPQSLTAPTGYFVSLQFDHDTVIDQDFRMSLRDDAGNVIESFVRFPKDPSDPNSQLQRNTISLTAHQPLRYETTYVVDVSGTVDGMEYQHSWSFVTRPASQH